MGQWEKTLSEGVFTQIIWFCNAWSGHTLSREELSTNLLALTIYILYPSSATKKTSPALQTAKPCQILCSHQSPFKCQQNDPSDKGSELINQNPFKEFSFHGHRDLEWPPSRKRHQCNTAYCLDLWDLMPGLVSNSSPAVYLSCDLAQVPYSLSLSFLICRKVKWIVPLSYDSWEYCCGGRLCVFPCGGTPKGKHFWVPSTPHLSNRDKEWGMNS